MRGNYLKNALNVVLFLLQYLLGELKCLADEVRCLVNADAGEVTNAVPDSWINGRQTDLPVSGERRHGWITIDKDVLFQNPIENWKETRQIKIPTVFGKRGLRNNILSQSSDILLCNF